MTAEYAVFADELQIKIAQGSKPGEGGQIPAHKVSDEIAGLRRAQPGVSLISPPPHHDIYSIEDLAQLVFDLREVNPEADVSVKLVAETGVGIVAAGVAKAHADVIHIGGADGGTGASPLPSIKHAGAPWEVGLAETQQALVANHLRGRVRVRVDGGLKTGRDVVVAALLGADEYSFGTALLLAEGCLMVRSCHLDTCPVGIATQQPELRAKFAGTPEMIQAYLLFVAEEVRRLLASLGLRSLDEAVGRVECLRQRHTGDPAADTLDLAPLLRRAAEGTARHTGGVPRRSGDRLGTLVNAQGAAALDDASLVEPRHVVTNGDRAIGARLGGAVAKRYGSAAPPGRLRARFEGSAGQSFGAFLTAGLELHLVGEANDYVGKAMSGGRIVVAPPADDAGTPCLIGNTALYGATGGTALLRRLGGRALRGPQLRRRRGRRGRGRPRLRVHDRGHGRRARRGRPQLRRGDDRRRGVRVRPRRLARRVPERRPRHRARTGRGRARRAPRAARATRPLHGVAARVRLPRGLEHRVGPVPARGAEDGGTRGRDRRRGRGLTRSSLTTMPKTLFDRIWESHVVREVPDGPALLYVDLHLIHEVTSAQAFDGLRLAGRRVRRTDLSIATMDHNVPTDSVEVEDPLARTQLEALRANCAEFGVPLYATGSGREGIVHVIGPELGLTQPGMTIVCGDSHTSTHGAFGALAFGVGTSEVEHVLATQSLPRPRPKTMRIRYTGTLPLGLTPKDVILGTIGRIGVDGAVGHVVEYAGEPIERMSMEGRLTVCNMSIEAGARAGMVAPDETTFAYLEGRPAAPKGADWEAALDRWRALRTDDDAVFDREVEIDVTELEPQVTWGTNPGMVAPVGASVPDPTALGNDDERAAAERALTYMGLEPGTPLRDIRIDRVFIGSCTNARIEDLREAAAVVAGKRVDGAVKALVVPGSATVKRQAEEEGLDRVFVDAGFEWRLAGCSMCLGMNPDVLGPGERCASTSNRNFEGRQGRLGRTHLMSPAMAAAAAIAGHIVDVRDWA